MALAKTDDGQYWLMMSTTVAMAHNLSCNNYIIGDIMAIVADKKQNGTNCNGCNAKLIGVMAAMIAYIVTNGVG